MTQQSLFELHHEPLSAPVVKPPPSGEQLRKEGQAQAAASKESHVGYARELAVDIAMSRQDRCCNMLLVNEALAAEGRPGLGPAAGSVFLSHVWEFTGQRVKDTRAHAHSNEIKVWRLKS
jgi:hypothetical protein